MFIVSISLKLQLFLAKGNECKLLFKIIEPQAQIKYDKTISLNRDKTWIGMIELHHCLLQIISSGLYAV